MEDPIQNPATRPRSIYLLPNLFTTAGLFAGFYGIVAAMKGEFHIAAIAVYVAMLMDGLDGRVARLTNTQSDFGAQYDSLADMVSFGLAPALIVYQWSLRFFVDAGWVWGKIGWLGAFFYVAAAALRLARFNTQVGIADKRFFQGLASPAAAGLLMGFVWAIDDMQKSGLSLSGADVKYISLFLTLAAGGLMVSNVVYYSFKGIDVQHKVPFVALLLVVLSFVLISFDPPKLAFILFLVYGLSGPVLTLIRRRRRRLRSKGSEPELP